MCIITANFGRWYPVKDFNLPAAVHGLIFDIDNTLYRNDEYLQSQTDLLIERLAEERGLAAADLADEIASYRDAYAAEHGGRRPSLGNTFIAFGVSIPLSVKWREELFRPQDFLRKDKPLIKTMENLADNYRLAAVTNNPTAVGQAALSCLGVEELFTLIVGLDTCLVSKPDPAPYRRAAEVMQLEPPYIVGIGDRYEIDIEPVIALGMGGILVESMDDVYSLDEYFSMRYKG